MREVFVVWVDWDFNCGGQSWIGINQQPLQHTSWIQRGPIKHLTFVLNKWKWTTCLHRGRSHLRWQLIPPPPFYSVSNPHTMQAKDCAQMCTQVMQANREETLRPTSLSAHLYGFYHPAASQTMHYKQTKLSSQSLRPRRYCLPPALILSSSSVMAAWIILHEEDKLTPERAEELFSELSGVFFLRL